MAATVSMGVYSDGSYGIEEGLTILSPSIALVGIGLFNKVDLNDFSVEKMRPQKRAS